MSLFGRFRFWAPTRFLEVICPRYDPGNDKDNIYKNTEDYNPNKEHKILIVFDDMIADMVSKKKASINSIRIIC